MRGIVDAALRRLSRRFKRLYVRVGHASIAAEKLLRPLILQVLYNVRRERQLVEQLHLMLLQWFVWLSLDEAVWDATTFTKNRDSLLDVNIATAFLQKVLATRKRKRCGRPFDTTGLTVFRTLGRRAPNSLACSRALLPS